MIWSYKFLSASITMYDMVLSPVYHNLYGSDVNFMNASTTLCVVLFDNASITVYDMVLHIVVP